MKTVNTINIIFSLLSFFIFLSVLPVYCDVSDKDLGISSEEKTSIRNFEKHTRESIRYANSLIRGKNSEKAKKELENTLVALKEKISAYENNARILVSKGKEKSAKIYSLSASNLNKIEIQISQSLKRLETLQKEEKLRTLRKEAIQYTTKGFEYLKTNDLDKAETNFKKAISISPDNQRAKDGLVRVEKARSRSQDQYVSELLKQAYSNIRANNLDKAEKQLTEALKLDPGNRRAQSYLKDIEKARSRSRDQYVSELLKQARSNIQARNFDKAEKELNEVLVLAPQNRQALNYLKNIEKQKLAKSRSELKQREEAQLKEQQKEQQLKENKFVELIKLGKKNLRENNFEEATRNFSEALKIKPKNELAIKYLNQTEKAKKDYEKNKDINKVITESKKYMEQEQLKQDINRLIKEIEVKMGEE
ncbi:MAG: hypothetical protein PHW62_04715 [Candidatus Ratteibacteria bacterium]|nr:hypothetical protein [Candidatus Ratteibacteria bacterium]